MPRGSPSGFQQLLRMQGFEWGDSVNDKHVWLDGDTLYIDARISAAAVGASAKPLLNYVPATMVANSYPITGLSGSGNQAATAFTVLGLPATAVAADLFVDFQPTGILAAGDAAQILTSPSQTNWPNLKAIVNNTALQSISLAVATGRTPVVPGATNQLAYTVTTAGTWALFVQLLGWHEPA